MSDRARFTDKVVFVTGAGSGIGRSTALAFAREGAKVAVVDINEAEAREVSQAIIAARGEAVALRCDVSRAEDVRSALDRTMEAFGRLDYAFNNAGIEQDKVKLAELPDKDWDRLVAINLSGVFHCMKQQIPIMRKLGGGAIVNTSSGAGVTGIAGQAAYVAVKHAVIGMTKSAALEYAREGLRINAICPGIIDTAMIGRVSGGTEDGRAAMMAQEPVGRMGSPEEIAEAVLYLCSDLAAFTIGHALVVDGGQTAGIV